MSIIIEQLFIYSTRKLKVLPTPQVPIDEHNLSYVAATRAQRALFLNRDVDHFLISQGAGKRPTYAVVAGEEGIPEVIGVPEAQAAIQEFREKYTDNVSEQRATVAEADMEAQVAEGTILQVSDLLKCPKISCSLPFRRLRDRAFDVWHRPSVFDTSEGILCPYCTSRAALIGELVV